MAAHVDPDTAPVAAGSTLAGEGPVIDLQSPVDDVRLQIAAACRDWGFFQVVNHGVPDFAVVRSSR